MGKFSPAQLRAQRAFAARARAGTLRKGSKLRKKSKSKRVRVRTRRVSKKRVKSLGRKKKSGGRGRKITIGVGRLAAGLAVASAAFPKATGDTIHHLSRGDWGNAVRSPLVNGAQDLQGIVRDPMGSLARTAGTAVVAGLALAVARKLPKASANLGPVRITAV